MSDETRPDEERTAAEERLLALLALIGAETGRDDPRGVAAMMRQVRWQRELRELMRALGDLAGALAFGVAAILGIPRRSGSAKR